RYLTQDEFAQRLEMSAANVRRLEQAEIGGMQVKNFRRLATLLNVAPDDLRRAIGAPMDSSRTMKQAPTSTAERSVGSPDFPPGVKPASQRDVVDIAHFHGVSAARIENRTDAARGRAPAPSGSQRRFAVTVDGDCMEPKYRDGDIVL